MMDNKIVSAVIWDLGGVLIDWNPEYLYSRIFRSEYAMKYFLTKICTPDWNEEQDGGRSFQEGTELLIRQFPEYTKEIQAFYGRWREMLGGEIRTSVLILDNMKRNGNIPLYALTNWSAESFPIALELYDFLHWFDGILVSGAEGIKKPDPAIYELILTRYQLDRSTVLFIDDNLRNIKAARASGIESIHYTDTESLMQSLIEYGVVVP
jgi:2-haloacid dehalogenase